MKRQRENLGKREKTKYPFSNRIANIYRSKRGSTQAKTENKLVGSRNRK